MFLIVSAVQFAFYFVRKLVETRLRSRNDFCLFNFAPEFSDFSLNRNDFSTVPLLRFYDIFALFLKHATRLCWN